MQTSSRRYWMPAGTDQYGLMLSAAVSWPGSHIGGALGSTMPPVSLFLRDRAEPDLLALRDAVRDARRPGCCRRVMRWP